MQNLHHVLGVFVPANQIQIIVDGLLQTTAEFGWRTQEDLKKTFQGTFNAFDSCSKQA